jgi:hypothetical protein
MRFETILEWFERKLRGEGSAPEPVSAVSVET